MTHNPVSVVCEIERFGYVSTPTPVCVVFVKMRFGCLSPPAPKYSIPVEGEDFLCG